MIKKYKLDILSFCIFTMIVFISFLVQTSSWHHFFGSSIIPQFWLAVSAYFAVYKNPVLTILMIYLISIVYSSSSMLPFGKILFFNVIVCLIAWSAFNLKNTKIFIAFYTGFIFSLPAIDWILSSLISTQPLNRYSFFNWTAVSIITSFWVIITVPLFKKLDFFIFKTEKPENEFKLMRRQRIHK